MKRIFPLFTTALFFSLWLLTWHRLSINDKAWSASWVQMTKTSGDRDTQMALEIGNLRSEVEQSRSALLAARAQREDIEGDSERKAKNYMQQLSTSHKAASDVNARYELLKTHYDQACRDADAYKSDCAELRFMLTEMHFEKNAAYDRLADSIDNLNLKLIDLETTAQSQQDAAANSSSDQLNQINQNFINTQTQMQENAMQQRPIGQ